uniref:Thiamine transporter 2 n=1 Tax=Syphacia muris TaxID=451379 RepID=A0A0N5AHN6_9BILA
MSWSYLTIILCFYAFIKEVKIGEPFMFKYQNEVLNLTKQQLTGEIYPCYTYAYLLFSIPIFLLTDLLLYKPTMVAEMVGQIIFRTVLVFGTSVFAQQVGQVGYGLATSCEIGFFSYIYARLEKDQHQKLTSWTRAAAMGGRAVGYLVSQTIVLSGIGDYATLNQVAATLPIGVFLIAIFLPNVHWRDMAKRLAEASVNDVTSESSNRCNAYTMPKSYLQYMKERLQKMFRDVLKIYQNGYIRKWSLWWALTTCMSLQVAQYAQAVWGEIKLEQSSTFNAFAEAAYTSTAFASIIIMSLIKVNWDKWGELILVLISATDTLCLLLNAQTKSIWLMYGCYIAYRSLYQVMMTIAQWNLARRMYGESYGLVFGFNTFVALVIQTVLTAVVSDRRGLALSPREQYVIYGGCHAVIGLIFLSSIFHTLIIHYCLPKTRNDKVLPKKIVEEKDDSKSAKVSVITNIKRPTSKNSVRF